MSKRKPFAHPSTSWTCFKLRPAPLAGVRGPDGLTRRPWLERRAEGTRLSVEVALDSDSNRSYAEATSQSGGHRVNGPAPDTEE
jgi:hypothetical protein